MGAGQEEQDRRSQADGAAVPGQKWEPEYDWKAKATDPYCDGVTGSIHSEWKRYGGATDRSEPSTSPKGWVVSEG